MFDINHKCPIRHVFIHNIEFLCPSFTTLSVTSTLTVSIAVYSYQLE